jgi:hypothetical protein
MKLSKQQSQNLLGERGVWVTSACDKCGQLLGSVRRTRRGEAGEWCSEVCRDGAAATARLTERRGLVRRKYATIEERIAARRKADRERKASRKAEIAAPAGL